VLIYVSFDEQYLDWHSRVRLWTVWTRPPIRVRLRLRKELLPDMDEALRK